MRSPKLNVGTKSKSNILTKPKLDLITFGLWGTIVLALLLRIYHLSYKSISIDESIGFFYVVESLKRVIIFTINDVHPPFFYIVHHFWIKIFGTSEVAIRSISVLFGILSIYGLYRLGALIFNRKIGLIAAFLLTISPWHIWLSQTARSNSMFLFLSILSTYGLFRITQTQSKKWFLFYSIVTVISLYTHYFAFTLWIAQALYMMFNPHSRKRLSINFWRLELAILISYCFWLPFMISQFITKTRPMYKGLSADFFKNLFDMMNPYISTNSSLIFHLSEFIFLVLFFLGLILLLRSRILIPGNGHSNNGYENKYKGLNLYLSTTPIIIFVGSLAAGIYFNMATSLPILQSNIAQNSSIYAVTIKPYHLEQLKSLPSSFFIAAIVMIILFILNRFLSKIVPWVYKMADRINKLTHRSVLASESFSPSFFFLFQFVVPIIIAGIVSLKSPYLIYRNMVIAIPFYFLIISYAIKYSRPKAAQILLLIFVSIASADSMAHFEEWNVKDDWRSAAAIVKEHMQPNDIILQDHLFGEKPFFYYGLKSEDPVRINTADSILSTYSGDVWFLVSYANKWSAEELLDKKFIRAEQWDFEGTTNPDDYRPRDGSLHLIHYKNLQRNSQMTNTDPTNMENNLSKR